MALSGVPDPELVEQAKRRSFTAEYKARILAEADACTRPGEVGELLRREGLYTSHLTYWRKQRKDGALKELGKPRGRKPADKRDTPRSPQLTRRARARGDGAREGPEGDRDPGKSLSALGADARYRGRVGEHRAMIERDRRRADADHRHQAGVPGGGRFSGDDLPPPAAATARGSPAAAGTGGRAERAPSARRC